MEGLAAALDLGTADPRGQRSLLRPSWALRVSSSVLGSDLCRTVAPTKS